MDRESTNQQPVVEDFTEGLYFVALHWRPMMYSVIGVPVINQEPIGSMYAIYGNIYHQYTPNVNIYTVPYMDPMGNGIAINKHEPWKICGCIPSTHNGYQWIAVHGSHFRSCCPRCPRPFVVESKYKLGPGKNTEHVRLEIWVYPWKWGIPPMIYSHFLKRDNDHYITIGFFGVHNIFRQTQMLFWVI